MKRTRETEEQLRARITDALVRDIGVSDRMAQPFVDSVMRCFAGERPYFPSHERVYPLMNIRAALENGASLKQVMGEYKLSRAKLHRLFPGGLPKVQKAGLSQVVANVETN